LHGQLVFQLLIASGMVALTVLVHLAGLAALIALMRWHAERLSTRHAGFDQVVVILGAAFGLFALHTVEIWGYALVYYGLGATEGFENALYFSTVTYATIGYGDLTLDRPWRILGAIEGANGVILLGWSTAFFISVVSRMRTLERAWLRAEET
jgi:hypothetical protein